MNRSNIMKTTQLHTRVSKQLFVAALISLLTVLLLATQALTTAQNLRRPKPNRSRQR